MRTYNQLVTDYTTLSRDASTANLALGKTLINRFIKKILMARDFTFNRSSKSITGIANQQAYNLPYNLERVKNVKVVVGTLNYFPREVRSRAIWTKLNRTTVSGNQTSRYFIEDDTIEVYPIFSSASPVMTIYYQKTNKDLAADAYTTGSPYVTTASPTYVTASPSSGTAWTSAMEDRHIKFDTDGHWYAIKTVSSPSELIVERDINQAINGSDYQISELIPLPYGYEQIPLWFALAFYFQGRKDNINQAREYERIAKEDLAQLLRRDAKSVNMVLEKEELDDIVGLYNINCWPEDIS